MSDKKKVKVFSPQGFLKRFAAITLSVLLLMAAVIFVSDPYVYYRLPEGKLIVNNYRFTNPGIVRNAEYDAVMLGSSMTQNFDMDLMRSQLGVDPVKITVGGMSVEGMELNLSLLYREGKMKTLYVCLDLPSLAKSSDDLSTYATYLYDDELLNDIKYLCGYETWLRLFPLNMAFSALDMIGYELPGFYATRDIDTIAQWHEGTVYGEDLLKNAYKKETATVSEQDKQLVLEQMKKNTDTILSLLQDGGDIETVLFLPPYSQLYWWGTQESGMLDVQLEMRQYIAEKVADMQNVSLYDFQIMEETLELDNYKDYTHYSKDLNDEMVYCFADGSYLVTPETMKENNAELEKLLDIFYAENRDWL